MSHRAATDLDEAKAALADARAAIDRASRVVANYTANSEGDVARPELPELPPPSEHRRLHRPGRPPKIDSDPELRAFIAARVSRMTFEAIAVDVAAHFSENRRVGKSAIHAWWKRNEPAHR